MAELEKWVNAYNHMLERVKKYAVDKGSRLMEGIDKAKEKAVELEELTMHEADEIGEFLRRDLHDAGTYLADTGQEFKQWLRFDMQLIEDRYLDMFLAVADQTKLELLKLEKKAQWDVDYLSGEVTGFGTLECLNCQQRLHFHRTSTIPKCDKCQHTRFQRIRDS